MYHYYITKNVHKYHYSLFRSLFYSISLPTAMFPISINPIHCSVCHWIFTVHAVFMRSNPVVDKNLLYFSVVLLYYTFCCRRYLRSSKTKITERNPNANAWSSLNSLQLSTCSRNSFQLLNYCYQGNLFKKVPCITELLLPWKPVPGTNQGPVRPPEDGQQVYEHM